MQTSDQLYIYLQLTNNHDGTVDLTFQHDGKLYHLKDVWLSDVKHGQNQYTTSQMIKCVFVYNNDADES